jgi:hypothetical protein
MLEYGVSAEELLQAVAMGLMDVMTCSIAERVLQQL